MSANLEMLCDHVKNCTEELEEQVKSDLKACATKIICNQYDDKKIALEKAKDYHYKEIIRFLKDIISHIKLVKIHQDKIKKLTNEANLPDNEIKRNNYVQRQISNFETNEEKPVEVKKRDKRREVSIASVESLNIWQAYLNEKEEECEDEKNKKSNTQRRKIQSTGRKKKKLVSSTFNNFLETEIFFKENLGGIKEDCEPTLRNLTVNDLGELSEYLNVEGYAQNRLSNKYSVMRIFETLNKNHSKSTQEVSNYNNPDIKPKIVDVLLKVNKKQI